MEADRFAKMSLVAAVIGSLVVALAALGSGCSVSLPGGQERCDSTNLLGSEGSRILIVLVVPAVLWICCLLGLLSVGIFFIPAALLMTIAAAQRGPVMMYA